MYMSHVTYADESGHIFECVGVTHVVSFAKESYKRDYILQKRPVVLRSLLIVATP